MKKPHYKTKSRKKPARTLNHPQTGRDAWCSNEHTSPRATQLDSLCRDRADLHYLDTLAGGVVEKGVSLVTAFAGMSPEQDMKHTSTQAEEAVQDHWVGAFEYIQRPQRKRSKQLNQCCHMPPTCACQEKAAAKTLCSAAHCGAAKCP